MRKYNTVLALAVIGAVPGLMLLQQFLMPRNTPAPPKHLMRKLDHRLILATEDGFICSRAHARHIAYAASVYAAKGEHRRAELWLQLGAAEFKYPSIMNFYGDYLFSRRRFKECRFWFLMAEKQALKDRQKTFADHVRKKIDVLDGMERRRKSR